VTAIPNCFIPQVSEVVEDCDEIAANVYGGADADHATAAVQVKIADQSIPAAWTK
jgi:hypothetical protein